jgi:hypothetical protein
MPRNSQLAPEAVIQRAVLAWLQCQPGCWAVKFPGVLQRGVPDILGVYRGVFFALEVKRPGQKPTALQLAILGQIRGAGGRTAVVTSIPDVQVFLRDIGEVTDE